MALKMFSVPQRGHLISNLVYWASASFLWHCPQRMVSISASPIIPRPVHRWQGLWSMPCSFTAEAGA